MPAGYKGPLFAEICPQTFPIVVRKGSRLSQIRFRVGTAADSDVQLKELHLREMLVSGADADIVIWDPEKRVKYGLAHSHQRTDYNLYEGWDLKGYPEKVFLRGKLIVDGEQWLGKRGDGKFLKRSQGEVL